jgi:hypothetical protein
MRSVGQSAPIIGPTMRSFSASSRRITSATARVATMGTSSEPTMWARPA